MPTDPLSHSDDTLAAPLGDLIAAVGRGVAEAQRSLDAASVETLRALAGASSASSDAQEKTLSMLRRMGHQPTWYRIPELEAELTVSLTVARTAESASAQQGAGPLRLYLSPVDASYVNRYEYNLQAASVIKFRVVPVPPSPQAAEMKIVPPLAGMISRDAAERLSELGIPFTATRPIGSGNTVESTTPGAGGLIGPGQSVTLTLKTG